MARMYRFTHRSVELIQEGDDSITTHSNHSVPEEVGLPGLTMFSTILFMNEFNQKGMGNSVDVSKTCNMSEWRRRLYAGAVQKPASHEQQEEEEEYVDVLTLPANPTSQSGIIYATTHTPQEGAKEAFSSFLFAIHKASIAQTVQSAAGGPLEDMPSSQALVSNLGATHIWLCGSDPEQRRHRLMSKCLAQLEKDVLEWKASGQGSGILTVHTIPAVFPGMVQFLVKNGFKGGDRVIGGEDGKVLYWKAL